MMASKDIAALEKEAYRARWDDGLVDLFVGLSLLWIGIAWLWLDPVAAFAGLFPAILAGPFVAWRTRFIEDRAGYVRFSEGRRRWERRNLVGLLLVGLVVLVGAVAVLVSVSDGSTVSDLLDAAGPGILAFLAAIPILIVAVAAMLPRLFAYAAVLVGAGAVAAALDTNPGLPLFAAGVVVTSVGVWLVRRFVRDHHRPNGSEAVAA